MSSEMREVAYLRLTLMDNGAMSIEGNIGDVKLALGMLKGAMQAVQNRLGEPSILEPHGRGIEVPNREVLVNPKESIYPLVAVGDRKS